MALTDREKVLAAFPSAKLVRGGLGTYAIDVTGRGVMMTAWLETSRKAWKVAASHEAVTQPPFQSVAELRASAAKRLEGK